MPIILTIFLLLIIREEITISYSGKYIPREQRRAKLWTKYGIDCTCPSCTSGPDLCRAFVCPNCKNGEVCPFGEGIKLEDWKCIRCGYIIKEEEREKFIQAETSAIKEGVTLENSKKYIGRKILHEVSFYNGNCGDIICNSPVPSFDI
jgi:rubredoxin